MYLGHRFSTSVKKNSYAPDWGETFEFKFAFEQKGRKLAVEVTEARDLKPIHHERARLRVTVFRAKNLIASDQVFMGQGSSSDPYVQVHIGSNVSRAQKTSVKSKSLNPEWNETLELDVAPNERSEWLSIECFDNDLVGDDDPLGKLRINLSSLALQDEPSLSPLAQWHAFEKESAVENSGQIELHCELIRTDKGSTTRAASQRMTSLHAGNPYITFSVARGTMKDRRAYSKVIRTTPECMDPKWGESLELLVSETELIHEELCVEVWDRNVTAVPVSDLLIGMFTTPLATLKTSKHKEADASGVSAATENACHRLLKRPANASGVPAAADTALPEWQWFEIHDCVTGVRTGAVQMTFHLLPEESPTTHSIESAQKQDVPLCGGIANKGSRLEAAPGGTGAAGKNPHTCIHTNKNTHILVTCMWEVMK